MSAELNEKMQKIKDSFKDFSNYLELDSFRDFLLFTLQSQVPSNVLAQLGIGGSKDSFNLPYNPIFKIYYQKINLMSGSLIVYKKSDPITDKFILKKDDEIFDSFLNQEEKSLALRGKEKFIFPLISDCNAFNDENQDPKLTVKLDDIFHSFESFIAITEPNILFVLDAKNDSEPDIIFAFNMMPEFPGKTNKKVLKIDAYFDKEHLTKDQTYLKREDDYVLKFLHEIKDISHAELYKSSFALISHIKSLNKPY